ncbi:hypothetical protein R3P38DRAFT_2783994 [Favolaschia claudopus]|uniref:Uncharacterized protein n=1 Tax=Favolaschia claudopus TaxID=2862362 RepID=A0AAW0AWZ3_9AGAR
MLGALKGALNRLIPRRRRQRSISSTESSEEEEVAPQYANLPIIDASELRATAIRSNVNGTAAYRDTEPISQRLKSGEFQNAASRLKVFSICSRRFVESSSSKFSSFFPPV